MTAWRVVPGLLALRDEYNAAGPGRDKGADGTFGDAAHQERPSDHNPDDTPGSKVPHSDADGIPEVHALDIDCSGPWLPGFSFSASVERVRARHAAGRDVRLEYIIWNGRIAERAHGYTWAPYAGADKHTGHAHFSSRYGSGSAVAGNPEADIRPWGVYPEVIVSQEDIDKIARAVADLIGSRLGLGRMYGARTVGGTLNSVADWGVADHDAKSGVGAKLSDIVEELAVIRAALPGPV